MRCRGICGLFQQSKTWSRSFTVASFQDGLAVERRTPIAFWCWAGGAHTNETTATTKNKGYRIGYTDWPDYRYERNAIHSSIPHFTPTTSAVLTGIGVTLFLSLYSHFTPATSAVIVSDIPAGWSIACRFTPSTSDVFTS